jgi:hypothetical protein
MLIDRACGRMMVDELRTEKTQWNLTPTTHPKEIVGSALDDDGHKALRVETWQ